MELNNEIKKGKVVLKSGDIFQSNLSGDKKGYFQFLYKDDSYLAGHLIRAFSFTQKDYKTLDEIVNNPIAFYGFTRVFEGLKEGYWIRLGNIPIENTFEPPMFKATKDTRHYVQKSCDWYIWKGDFANAKKIGEMTEEYRGLPFSSVVSPESIVEWLEAGKQVFNYLPD